jgi:exonuclease III
MSILGLNCRGLGLDTAVGELRDLVRSYNPAVVFLSETKMKSRAITKLKWSLGFQNGVAVDCVGRSGGMALWWREGVDVSVRPWCQYYIDAKISLDGRVWRFTGIYGEPRTELRHRTWEALRYLRRQDDLPWICAGDFNEILRQDEQIGGNPRNEGQMQAFRDCLLDCGFTDLGYTGYSFTWNNRRDGEANIQVRLDRGVATASFLEMFPNAKVEHIMTEESDHMALLIRTEATAPGKRPNQQRGFMFEEMWLKHDGYDHMIQEAWDNNPATDPGIQGFWKRLQDMSRDIKRWSLDTFGSV